MKHFRVCFLLHTRLKARLYTEKRQVIMTSVIFSDVPRESVITILFDTIENTVAKHNQCDITLWHGLRIENRMNASAFRNIWARVMFFKFSKLHEPQAIYHEMQESTYDFLFIIF